MGRCKVVARSAASQVYSILDIVDGQAVGRALVTTPSKGVLGILPTPLGGAKMCLLFHLFLSHFFNLALIVIYILNLVNFDLDNFIDLIDLSW